MDIAEAITAVEAEIQTTLSPKRAGHCRRTAARAAELCTVFGIDPCRGTLAGLAHDMCRELPAAEQWRLAKRLESRANGSYLTESLREDPLFADKIVHGPAAAERLIADFGIDDSELLEAVALHSLGDPAMRPLPAVLFIADKTEPGRGRWSPEKTETRSPGELRILLAACVESSIAWLEAKGATVARRSRDLYNALKAETRQE